MVRDTFSFTADLGWRAASWNNSLRDINMLNYHNLDDSQIQGLKAQEAKDLACQMLETLLEKDRGPISPGEVQVRELEFELKLKQAEREDAERQAEHELRVKELELQIEQERREQSAAQQQADQVRAQFARLVEQVRGSEESLGVQLERATREHRLRLEKLASEFEQRRGELDEQIAGLDAERETLRAEIAELAELRELAGDVREARETLAAEQRELERLRSQTDQEIAELEHEKNKRVTALRRAQELELAELETAHARQKLQQDRDTAISILESLGSVVLEATEVEQLRRQAEQHQHGQQAAEQQVAERVRREVLEEFHITSKEPLDVTELYYRHAALERENGQLQSQLEKLDRELQRARAHIEAEPERVAKTVEAARTSVQNFLEPAQK